MTYVRPISILHNLSQMSKSKIYTPTLVKGSLSELFKMLVRVNMTKLYKVYSVVKWYAYSLGVLNFLIYHTKSVWAKNNFNLKFWKKHSDIKASLLLIIIHLDCDVHLMQICHLSSPSKCNSLYFSSFLAPFTSLII